MNTRLTTSVEEAKALRDAGYPQDIGDGLTHYLCCADDAPTPHDADTAYAPRLDEILAFMWQQDVDGLHIEQPSDDTWSCFFSTSVAHGGEQGVDQLAAVVATVLHFLNSERSPA